VQGYALIYILLISHVIRDPSGGAASCTLALADEWRRDGVTVVDFYRDELPGVHAGRLSPDLLALRAAWFVAARRDRPDVVIATGPLGWATFRLLRMVRRGRSPLFVSLSYGLEHEDHEVQVQEASHGGAGMSFLARMRWSVFVKPAVESSIVQSDLFLAPRRRDTERAVESGWKRPGQVLATGWGVANEASLVDLELPRRAWTGRVAWCGTVVDRKGWRYFRDGFTEAARALPELRLDVFGSRLEPESLTSQFPSEMAARVSVLPILSRTEQFRQMASMDVLVSTSLSEGYHLAVQEAMALGVPVIATAEGFLADLVTSARPILEIPKRDAHAVCEAILRVAADDPLRVHLSSSGMSWAASHSWELIARRVTSTLVAALSTP